MHSQTGHQGKTARAHQLHMAPAAIKLLGHGALRVMQLCTKPRLQPQALCELALSSARTHSQCAKRLTARVSKW